MKKSLESLKEKFSKFELSKEQVQKVKGGDTQICYGGKNNQIAEIFANFDGVVPYNFNYCVPLD